MQQVNKDKNIFEQNETASCTCFPMQKDQVVLFLHIASASIVDASREPSQIWPFL